MHLGVLGCLWSSLRVGLRVSGGDGGILKGVRAGLSESDYSVRQITVYGKLHTESDFPLIFLFSVFGFFGFLNLGGGAAGPGMAINGRLGSGGFRFTEYHQNPGSGKPFRGHFPFSQNTM